ncbi:MAG: glycosyltransferase family 4 protein [Patescibacteria group bacterium]
MGKFIPKILKYPLIVIYVFVRCLLRGASAQDIKLNLLGVLPPPDSKKIVHGGKVKLLHLRERFGDSWRRFNIAYFASSGLPFAPTIWIKIYKLFGVKTVWNQNGVAYPAWAGRKTKSVNKLLSPIHLSDHVIYQTEFCKKSADRYLGKFNGPSTVLINPVDINHFKPEKLPLPPEPLIIIISGHHFESKERLDISLEAVRKLRRMEVNAKLLVIGNTQEVLPESWIETVGKFTQEEAPALYQRAHLLLHLKNLDPCPTIVLEALSSGLPVVGLGNGGMPELVNQRCGVLIPAREDFEKFHYPTPREVADAILETRMNLKSLSAGAREQALRFDKEKWLKRHEQIFEKLCRKSQ